MKTNLFIAGFSKCGTTSLFDILTTSNCVAGGNSKEPGFFSTLIGRTESGSDLDWSTGGNYILGLPWYESIYRGVRHAPYRVDASTVYGFDPDSPALIHAYNPGAKIVFIVRDPYDRIESHFFQESKTGMRLPDFQSFMGSDHKRLAFYKQATRYRETILRYLKYFPEDQIHVLSLEKLKNLDQLSRDLSSFLEIGLHLESTERAAASNRRKVARSASIKRVLILIERSRLARRCPRWIQRLGSLAFRKVDVLLLRDLTTTPTIDPAIKARIRHSFLEDLRFLDNRYDIVFRDCAYLLSQTDATDA